MINFKLKNFLSVIFILFLTIITFILIEAGKFLYTLVTFSIIPSYIYLSKD